MSFGLVVWVGMVSFGVGTSCTNAWSCSSSDCSPCRVVSMATFGGIGVGAALGAVALFSPWPRHQRSVLYTAAIVATGWLTLVAAQTWGSPPDESGARGQFSVRKWASADPADHNDTSRCDMIDDAQRTVTEGMTIEQVESLLGQGTLVEPDRLVYLVGACRDYGVDLYELWVHLDGRTVQRTELVQG